MPTRRRPDLATWSNISFVEINMWLDHDPDLLKTNRRRLFVDCAGSAVTLEIGAADAALNPDGLRQITEAAVRFVGDLWQQKISS